MISARAGSLADCMRLSGLMPERHARALAAQCWLSEMIAVEDERGLACVLGFLPLARRYRGALRFEMCCLRGPMEPRWRPCAPWPASRGQPCSQGPFWPHPGDCPCGAGWQPGRKLARMIGLTRCRGDGLRERYGGRAMAKGVRNVMSMLGGGSASKRPPNSKPECSSRFHRCSRLRPCGRRALLGRGAGQSARRRRGMLLLDTAGGKATLG